MAEHQLDDCWNRMGIRGDRSCTKLTEYSHCHHCPVYAEAAKRILDFYSLSHQQADISVTSLAQSQASESLLVFRLGDQWLALSLDILSAVAPLQSIHSLPHRRSDMVLGVSNVRGALVACLSLSRLLNLDNSHYQTTARVTPRMLIISQAAEEKVVCPVDDVLGIHAITKQQFVNNGDGKFTKAVFQWQDHSVSLIDNTWLLAAIKRSLS
jgi:chemotaxis-related protein WspD